MQLVYGDQPLGIHGQLAEAYPSAIVSGLASTVPINVGTIVNYNVTAGLDPKSIRPVASSADVTTLLAVMGLAMWDPTYPEPPYRVNASVPVMRRGRVWIVGETALNAHANPFVRFVAGAGGTILGSLRVDADSATAVAAPYLTVVVGAAAGSPALVEVAL